MRDLNSRVTEEHSRARVRDRHQLVDCDRLLGASQSAGSPRDWNTSSAYWRPASKLKRSKMSKAKMSQRFFPGEKRKKGGFFCKPPAFHRLLFMSPFAGDIRAGPGSLKWIAQIPRKAHRWSLGRGSKCCDWVSNVEAKPRERLFLMRSPRKNP